MIILGLRDREKEISSGQFNCPKCATLRPYKLIRVVNYFTLYFIPLFKTKKGREYVECQYCHQTFKPEVLDYKPPSQAERLVVTMRAELESGMPLHMIRQKLTDMGFDAVAALQIVTAAAGDNSSTCPKCGFIYRYTITTCPNCGTRLHP